MTSCKLRIYLCTSCAQMETIHMTVFPYISMGLIFARVTNDLHALLSQHVYIVSVFLCTWI